MSAVEAECYACILRAIGTCLDSDVLTGVVDIVAVRPKSCVNIAMVKLD